MVVPSNLKRTHRGHVDGRERPPRLQVEHPNNIKYASSSGERPADDSLLVLSRYSISASIFFAWVFEKDLSSQFHAVRVLGCVPNIENGPTILYSNHPSWWDGELFVWLARRLFPAWRAFAPMDARMIAQYRFFERIGAFGVQSDSRRGASTFSATARQVLSQPDCLLILPAEGRFNDIRNRLSLSSGLLHLARRIPNVVFVPVALEYTFWNERRPNILLRFGHPVQVQETPNIGYDELDQVLARALSQCMNDLAIASATRDAALFQTILKGKVRVNRLFDLGRRIQAVLRGASFNPAHFEDDR